MEKLKVNGHLVEVDYPAELEMYIERFEKVRIRGEKLQACSPFRDEHHPSFAVNLENGSWVDSGADEESQRKGSFISLLAHFRGETYDETAEYLLDKYTHILDDAEKLELNLNLQLNEPELAVLGQEKYSEVVSKPSNYLLKRGIAVKTQLYFKTGRGEGGACIAIPWHDKAGRIINIKYRSTKGKEFWFSSGGQPIKQHVYGLFAVIKLNVKEVWAVESEIDALYLWSLGIPAVAFGGASMNDIQKNLLLNSGIESIVIATDNDTVGQRFAKALTLEFAGLLDVKKVKFPLGKKDMNDLLPDEVLKVKSELLEFKELIEFI